MIEAKEHSGKLLVSLTDGKKLGKVEDLYLDSDARRVVSVFLGTEGFISRKALAIARGDVRVVGVDVLLVAGPDVVQALESIPDSATFTRVDDLRGRDVQTEGGTRIGVVEDVLLDDEMRVLGIRLGKVFVQGPVAERKAIAREALTSLGSKDVPMTAVMEKAESMDVADPHPR